MSVPPFHHLISYMLHLVAAKCKSCLLIEYLDLMDKNMEGFLQISYYLPEVFQQIPSLLAIMCVNPRLSCMTHYRVHSVNSKQHNSQWELDLYIDQCLLSCYQTVEVWTLLQFGNNWAILQCSFLCNFVLLVDKYVKTWIIVQLSPDFRGVNISTVCWQLNKINTTNYYTVKRQ